MVAPAFGFSVGDFIAGTNVLINVFGAFREVGGASSKYTSEVLFLNSLTSTLKHLEEYVNDTPQNDISQEILKLLELVKGPLDSFKTFLDKYEASLGNLSSKSRLGKAPKKITYTLKEISGKVEKLRLQVEQPLQAVNSLLSLQAIKSIEKLPDQPLRPAQCAQIIEAIKIADIPTELEKQIQVLQRSAQDHRLRQDEQLQRVQELRAKLDDSVASLQAAVDTVNDTTASTMAASTAANQNGQHALLDTLNHVAASTIQLTNMLEVSNEKLEASMKDQNDQRQLLSALKSFLEDKSAMQQAALESKDDIDNQTEEQQSKWTWLPAILPTAQLAITLLSTVMTSVAARSIVAATSVDVRKPSKRIPEATAPSSNSGDMGGRVTNNNGQQIGWYDQRGSGLGSGLGSGWGGGLGDEFSTKSWYCGSCRDGPKRGWMHTCASCAHVKCPCCRYI